ncbi:MAG TPA: tripartite tricarboxylate transporter substrate-binding protein [Ramlibacter sp.]|nr:tripartite tricarboxylate transporter substrate-binding protein [Ramlibacter sp.]
MAIPSVAAETPRPGCTPEAARRRLLLAGLGLLAVPSAFGQLTGRPLRIINAGSAGSGLSLVARTVAPPLASNLGVPVVVEDIPGAGGVVGTTALVRSPPDGHTLGILGTNHLINPHVFKSIPFDSLADITPIAVLGSTPVVMVVNPTKLPVRNLQELLRLLRAEPARYGYGSAGNGTILHLAGELFLDEGKSRALHVPYKGVAPLVTDLLAGQVDFAPLALPTVRQHLRSGALRAIGVAGASRLPSAPEIPTFAEQGLPGFQIDAWFSVVGPARMGAPLVRRLNEGFAAAFAAPEVRDAMARDGTIVQVSTSEHAAQFFASQQQKYARLASLARLERQ